MGHPLSVQGLDKTHVNKLNIGPTLARGPQQPNNFWDFLRTWGGEWMWEGIEDGQATKHDLSWLVQGMESNTLLWVTDGSYNRKRAPVQRSRMDYFLANNWQMARWFLLGKVLFGKLLPSRVTRPMFAPHICIGTVRVLQVIRLESNAVL
jgi:hypothetical protein